MKTKTLLKILAMTACMGGLLGDCGTTLPPLPSPLNTHAMRAPTPTHVPAPQLG